MRFIAYLHRDAAARGRKTRGAARGWVSGAWAAQRSAGRARVGRLECGPGLQGGRGGECCALACGWDRNGASRFVGARRAGLVWALAGPRGELGRAGPVEGWTGRFEVLGWARVVGLGFGLSSGLPGCGFRGLGPFSNLFPFLKSNQTPLLEFK